MKPVRHMHQRLQGGNPSPHWRGHVLHGPRNNLVPISITRVQASVQRLATSATGENCHRPPSKTASYSICICHLIHLVVFVELSPVVCGRSILGGVDSDVFVIQRAAEHPVENRSVAMDDFSSSTVRKNGTSSRITTTTSGRWILLTCSVIDVASANAVCVLSCRWLRMSTRNKNVFVVIPVSLPLPTFPHSPSDRGLYSSRRVSHLLHADASSTMSAYDWHFSSFRRTPLHPRV